MKRQARGAPKLRAMLGAAIAFAAAALLPPAAAGAEPVLVFAAASLRDTVDEAARTYEAKNGVAIKASYAASSALAKQLEAGAPAHLFISADGEWAEYVRARGLSRAGPTPLASNTLVLIAPQRRAPPLKVAPGFELSKALAGGRLAVADPRAVPAGKYARASLEALGAWKDVEDRLAPAADVRAALALVARGEAALGIVYRTDAATEPAVEIVDALPPSSHPRIVYPMLVLKGAPPAADGFARFLASPEGQAAFKRRGFGPP